MAFTWAGGHEGLEGHVFLDDRVNKWNYLILLTVSSNSPSSYINIKTFFIIILLCAHIFHLISWSPSYAGLFSPVTATIIPQLDRAQCHRYICRLYFSICKILLLFANLICTFFGICLTRQSTMLYRHHYNLYFRSFLCYFLSCVVMISITRAPNKVWNFSLLILQDFDIWWMNQV